jgi:hypothetical protein
MQLMRSSVLAMDLDVVAAPSSCQNCESEARELAVTEITWPGLHVNMVAVAATSTRRLFHVCKK